MNRDDIARLVEKSIPRFSGKEKIFLVTLQLGADTVKMVFWRPNNYTMVAHDHQAPIGKDCEIFCITSFHDSCWRYDGLSFLNRFPWEEQKKMQIVSSELLDFQKCLMDEEENFFTILKG